MATGTDMTARGWAEIAALAVIWGGSFLAIRIALDEVPVATSVAHRVLWAALALQVAVRVTGRRMPGDARTWGALFVMGLLNNVLPFLLMAWGQLHIASGLTAILNASAAVFGILVAAALLPDERLTARRLAGVALGFGGVVAVIGPDALRGFDLRSLAQVAVVAGAVSYALAGAWGRLRLAGVDGIVAAAAMLTCSAAVAVPVALAVDGPPDLTLAARTWAAIGYYALVSTALAYLIYYAALRRSGAGNLLLVTLLVAPVAVTLGALVRDEALAPRAFLGFGLIAAGLVVIATAGRAVGSFPRSRVFGRPPPG